MITDEKIPQGTSAWFEMVGTVLRDAAAKAGLSPVLTVSFLERYTDGTELAEGLVQGIRFDITGGQPSFRVGAQPGEQADVVVHVTADAARKLNSVYSADPAYKTRHDNYVRTGEWRADGDLARLGSWLDSTHDPVVARTR